MRIEACVTAALRQRAWAPTGAAVADLAARERPSRQFTWAGTGHTTDAVREGLTQAALDAIEQETIAFCAARLPHVPETDMQRMEPVGIIAGPGGCENSNASVLSYPSLNGFDIPRQMARSEILRGSGGGPWAAGRTYLGVQF